MPVGREALVCRILRRLAEAGIREAVLNLHHLPETITREVGDGSQCGLRVRYSWEQPRVLGSAGGPRHALPLVDADTLLIVNGDTLCDLPIRALWDAHVGQRRAGHTRPDAAPASRAATAASCSTAGKGHTTSGAVTGIRAAHEQRCRARTSPASRSCIARCSPTCRRRHASRERAAGLSATDGVAARRCRGAVFDAHFDDVGTVEDYRRTCRALAGDARRQRHRPQATVAADARPARLRRLARRTVPPALRPAGRRRHAGTSRSPPGTQPQQRHAVAPRL